MTPTIKGRRNWSVEWDCHRQKYMIYRGNKFITCTDFKRVAMTYLN